MAKVQPIQVGKARAVPTGGNVDTGTGVVSWAISVDGARVAVVPAAQFAADGQRMLECYDRGEAYVPAVEFAGAAVTPPLAWKQRRELLEQGRDHTIRVDAFTRSLAGGEADEGGVYRQALERHTVEQWPGLERELYAGLYGATEPLADVAPADLWLQEIQGQAEGLPEWEALRRQCQGDPWAAGIGAGRVTEALGKVLDEAICKLAPTADPVRQEEESEELEALAPGAGEAAAERAQKDEGKALALSAELQKTKRGLALRKAISAGAEAAEEEIESIQVAMAGLGAADAPGVLSAVKGPTEQVRKVLMGNPKLRRVAEIAGKLRLRARGAQRRKVQYVPEQVVDVTLGAELARLLPSETMLLATEETELALIRKLVDRQALQYQFEGTETEDRGPVVLCVDGSGSMQGARNEWAMGVALALLEVCALQRRAFCLVHFDARVQKTFEVPRSGRLTLNELVAMVSFFSGGDTAFGPPLDWARAKISTGTWKQSDVILLTDGGGQWQDSVVQLKAIGAAVYGVALETDFTAEQKTELAGVARIEKLGTDGAVDLVFGI